MTSDISPDERSSLRMFVYGIALIAPPLLAYNWTPSATQLNELLCVFGWGLCMLLHTATPPTGARRGAINVLCAALGVMSLAVVGSWTIGSLPTSLALPPLALLIVAGVVAALGARVAQGGERDGLQAFVPFAYGVVAVGFFSALIAVIQVYVPSWADGNVIAQSGLPGRAVGNLRQPNHLASLLIWSVIALVPLVEWRRVPAWLGAGVGILIMVAVVLSGSRTGLYGGVAVLVFWGAIDSRLSRGTRGALIATLVFPLGVFAWQWLTLHTSFMPHVAGAATRLSEGDSSHFAIWKNAVEMVRQQPLLGVGWGEFNFAWTLTPFPHRPTAFFDHTHDLPLQLIVELGIADGGAGAGAAGVGVRAGLPACLGHRRATGHGARAAWVMILMIAIHSLDEYPLWYAYFLLPAAWAWGFALGSGPAPKVGRPDIERHRRRSAGGQRQADPPEQRRRRPALVRRRHGGGRAPVHVGLPPRLHDLSRRRRPGAAGRSHRDWRDEPVLRPPRRLRGGHHHGTAVARIGRPRARHPFVARQPPDDGVGQCARRKWPDGARALPGGAPARVRQDGHRRVLRAVRRRHDRGQALPVPARAQGADLARLPVK
jgi:O-antigen ligase